MQTETKVCGRDKDYYSSGNSVEFTMKFLLLMYYTLFLDSTFGVVGRVKTND